MARIKKQIIKIKPEGFKEAIKQLEKACKEFKKAEVMMGKIKINIK